MGKWLLGQGSLMLILGMTSTIVYLLLGVRYAYALGALTGLLNIIPGHWARQSVSCLRSWWRRSTRGAGCWGLRSSIAIYLQVENSFLVPRIMKSRVGCRVWRFWWRCCWALALAGVVGALVSVPTAVLVAELVDEYLVNKGSEFRT